MRDEHHRRVPGDDRTDDADRLTHQQAELAAAGWWTLLLEREAVGERGVRLERTGSDDSGVLRLVEQRSGLARPQLPQHVVAFLEPGAHRAQISRSLGVAQARPRPFVERLAGGRDRPRHVVASGGGDAVVHLFGARVDDVDRGVGRGLAPAAINEEAVRVMHRCSHRSRSAHLSSPSPASDRQVVDLSFSGGFTSAACWAPKP